MAPSLRRSTLFSAAGLLAFAAAAGPAAALGVTPGALSSFHVAGGQWLGEGSQGSAQQCLDACFSVANCNAASFCANSGGCEGGKPANTCTWFRVDDIYNPPGEASGNWQSGTVSTSQPQQQQAVQEVPVQQQEQQPQQVYYNNGYGYNNGVRPATAAAVTAAVVSNNNAPVVARPVAAAAVISPNHNVPVVRPANVVPVGPARGGTPRGRHDTVGRRLMMAAAV